MISQRAHKILAVFFTLKSVSVSASGADLKKTLDCLEFIKAAHRQHPELVKSVLKAAVKNALADKRNPAKTREIRFRTSSVFYQVTEGNFDVHMSTPADAAEFQRIARKRIWEAVNHNATDPQISKFFYHSAKEDKAIIVRNISITFNGIQLIYQNADNKISTTTPAKQFHIHASMGTQLLISPEKLLQSYEQIHQLEDVTSQREWITVALLEEAALWKNHVAPPQQSQILDKHISILTNFDRRARASKSSYVSPLKIAENIALAKLWIDHHLALAGDLNLSALVESPEQRSLNSSILEDALTLGQNFYELWKSTDNVHAKKKLANMVDDSKMLAELLFMANHPHTDPETSPLLVEAYKRDLDIHPTTPLSSPETPTLVTDAQVSSVEKEQDDESAMLEKAFLEGTLDQTIVAKEHARASAETINPQTEHDPLKFDPSLILHGNGNLILPAHMDKNSDWMFRVDNESALATESHEWTIRLNRKSQKDWTRLSNYADAKGVIFFRRMNQALGTILRLGYYKAFYCPGFPRVKQIQKSERAFELILGSERRIVYLVDSSTHTITVTSISEHHKVEY